MRKSQGDNEARPDELGNDSGQVGPTSAGQSGDPQGLSPVEDASIRGTPSKLKPSETKCPIDMLAVVPTAESWADT